MHLVLQIEARKSRSQRIFLYLAHGISRQLLEQQYPFWYLVPREPRTDGINDASLRQAGVGLANDNCRYSLAKIRMRNPEDGAFQHASQRIQLQLDLLGVDIVATADHEILCAADDMDIAVSVDPTEISGFKPAIRSKFVARFLR